MTATALVHPPVSDWNDAPLLDQFEATSIPPAHLGSRPALRLVQPGAGPGRTPRDLALVEVHRRRRFLTLLVATVVVVVVSQLVGVSLTSFGPATTANADPALPVVHLVVPGDSYGSIAASLGLPEPARAADRLRVANGGGELVIGQRLVFSAEQLHAWDSTSSQVPHEDDVVGQ